MPTAIIENFARGLDTRRSELTTALGVLTALRNAHINQGAEIEKRKAFVPQLRADHVVADLMVSAIKPTAASGVTKTFGLVALRDYMVIFGGDFNQDGLWPEVPFRYQQLCYPGTEAEVMNPDVKAIDIVYATAFNNKTFVIAVMQDRRHVGDATQGIVLNCFYDGALVTDINFFGRVLPHVINNAGFYKSMLDAFSAVKGYRAVLNNTIPPLKPSPPGPPIPPITGIFVIGATGVEFTVSQAGTGTFEKSPLIVRYREDLPPVPDTPATPSTATISFSIVLPEIVDRFATVGPITVESAPGVTPPATPFEILTTPVQAGDSLQSCAERVVNAINNPGNQFYSAALTNQAGGVQIKSKEGAVGANDKILKITSQMGVFIGYSRLKFIVNAPFMDVTSILCRKGDQTQEEIEVYDHVTPLGGVASDSLPKYISRVVKSINDKVTTPKYKASAVEDKLYIGLRDVESFAPNLSSSRVNNRVIGSVSFLTDIDGNIEIEGQPTIQAIWEQSQIEVFYAAYWDAPRRQMKPPDQGVTRVQASFLLDGGLPPYKFDWHFRDLPENLHWNVLTRDKSKSHLQQTRDIWNISAGFPAELRMSNTFTSYLYVDGYDAEGIYFKSAEIPVLHKAVPLMESLYPNVIIPE